MELARQHKTTGVKRGLIVDDHPDITEVLSILLGTIGIETRCASRGRDALRIAREFDPDVILVDIGLPDINGYEVVRALRDWSRGADRYIAAITGWARPQDIERSFKTGFDAHLLKPVDLAKIRRILVLAAEKRLRASCST